VLIPGTVTLRYPDPDRALVGVRLLQEIGLPADVLDFEWDGGDRAWRRPLPPLPVRRFEYRLELHHPDRLEVVLDPINPLRAPGGYGEKSVLELDGYHPPEWLTAPAAPGEWRDLAVPSRSLRADVPVRVWTPQRDVGAPRGLLLAHDGGEFDRLIGLGRHSAAAVAAGTMPPHHLVLLSPLDRNDWYSANPAYAKALAADVLPAVRAALDTRASIIALGASLGGLAMLHAQRTYPRLFAGMFLQSGSFFQHRFDSQESSFAAYDRILAFVAGVKRRRRFGSSAPTPVPTVMTCGLAEENLDNNRDMAATLRRQGYPLRWVEVPDAHNLTAWRDAWHPPLGDLARGVWTG
jgi:enterochelin esterase family protein